MFRALKKRSKKILLKLRYKLRSKKENTNIQDIFSELDIFYINLKHRQDRKIHIENEFKKLEISKYNRFNAVRAKNGLLGCTKSHLEVMKNWDRKKFLLMVCEDDCTFLIDKRQLENLLELFVLDTKLDVLCLAYNDRLSIAISQDLKITSDTQTGSCYIVKNYAIDSIISNFSESVTMLENGVPNSIAAIDVNWKKLQRHKLIFAIPKQRSAFQIESYSDIEKKITNYNL